jgi:tetratricopeptide (TPR) repeat protein
MRRGWQAAVGLTLIVVALSLNPARGASGDGVIDAAPCSVAAERDASNNTLTCYFGLTAEQLRQLADVAAASRHAMATNIGEVIANVCSIAAANDVKDNKVNCTIGPSVLVDQIKDVSSRLNINQNAVFALLRVVGEDPNIPDDKLDEALTKVAGDYNKLQAQVAALNPENPQAKVLIEQAKPEIDAGHFQRARELLRQATQVQIAAAQEARKLREQAQTAEETQMLGAASSTAAEGDVAMTERRYKEAEDLFAQAAGYVPSGHQSEHGAYLMRQEGALYRQGYELGDSAALSKAIEVCEHALSDYTRDRTPLDWATIQDSLGIAFERLGEREAGTVRLEEAVAAFHEALEELTRERVPLTWAATQTDLGNALQALGDREPGTERLDEAVAAYRAALEERTRERVPLDWAMTQNNLGTVLARVGERESGTAKFKEAAAAYRLALEELTQERAPLKWATTQNNLGDALRILGLREGEDKYFEEAVDAFRAALRELTRERVPLQWAATQNNLGHALLALGASESGTVRLEEAVTAYGAAIDERTRERLPLDWAESFGSQGFCMMLIADRTNDPALAANAVEQIEAAYETVRDGQTPWAAYYAKLLPLARKTRDRLNGK